MPDRVWQELWMLVVLRLGGPLDPASAKGKGKAVKGSGATEQDTKMVLLGMLRSLMEPVALVAGEGEGEDGPDGGDEGSDDDDPLGDNINWDGDEPVDTNHSSKSASDQTPQTRTLALPPPPPLPIIFHTLTTLLHLAATPTSLHALQLSALDGLACLVTRYLASHPASPNGEPLLSQAGPSPLIATALPGAASGLARIAVSKSGAGGADARRQPQAVVVRALEVLSVLMENTVGDQVTKGLREEGIGSADGAKEATLEEIIERFASNPDSDPADDTPAAEEGGDVSIPQPSDDTSITTTTASAAPPPTSGPTSPTPAWLRYTASNLLTLISTLSSLLPAHDSPTVRIALGRFLAEVLLNCSSSLSLASPDDPSSAASSANLLPALEGLLALAADDWPSVADPARAALLSLMAQPTNVALVARVIQSRLAGLPRALLRGDEAAVARSARVIAAALALLPPTTTPLARVERWSWSLMHALDFDRVAGAGERQGAGMAQAWISSGGVDLSPSEGEKRWPGLRMKHVREKGTRKALEGLWAALGRSAAKAGQEGEAVDHFLGVATGASGARQASGLWVVAEVLAGLDNQDGTGPTKPRRKLLKGVVKRVLELLERLEVDDEPATQATPAPPSAEVAKQQAELASIVVEQQRAVSYTPSLDVLAPVATKHTAREAAESDRIVLTCLALRVLAAAAHLLGPLFQPHLLKSLYHVLAHSSPASHPLLRAHAQLALSSISSATAYASPQNLVLANVDYVVNAVTQRLSIARLDPQAPVVLVEMIRLVGAPIVPMVGDLVEDVFEALDDYHGYDEVTAGLWGVLDGLVRVMVQGEEDKAGPKEEVKAAVTPETKREEDWATFTNWFAHRHDPPPAEETVDLDDDLPAENPQAPFSELLVDDHPDEPKDPNEFPDKPKAPPIKSQALAAQILTKATYYLSHASPFLRGRVVGLIASAVPLLVRPSLEADKGRPEDLLPTVHKAWPYLLMRLEDSEASVREETAALVESLAAHVGGFMSRRILDDAWPRFRRLLEQQGRDDRRSALAGMTTFSQSHRFYRSLLRTMRAVDGEVPLKEEAVWDQAVLFRRFLDGRIDPELQALAKGVYTALGRVNADLVWLVLVGSVGGERAVGLPVWLRMAEADLGANVEAVLREL